MRTLLTLLLTAPLAAQEADARALFLHHCASCHGERGDGKGTTLLPRPPRSFLDGGSSYGDTRAAIGRAVEYGIPGRPMPSFVRALTAEQRAGLVEYVIALGPQRRQVTRAETVLEVTDRPLVVRGFLPALAEGAPELPRGLLVGLTSGTTFQYRADDVRLLAVRQGEFVERGGRGEDPLRPLGALTHLVEGGRPGVAWSAEQPLHARLASTSVSGDEVTIAYELRLGDQVLARVEETPRVVQTIQGAGFARELHVTAVESARTLHFRWGAPVDREVTREIFMSQYHEWVFSYQEAADRAGPTDPRRGRHQVVVLLSDDPGFDPSRAGNREAVTANELHVHVAPDERTKIKLFQMTLIDGSRDARLSLLREINP